MCCAPPTLALVKRKYFKTYKLETVQLKPKHGIMPKLWSGPSQEVYLAIHYKRYTALQTYVIDFTDLFFFLNTIFITILKIRRKNWYELYLSEKVLNLAPDVDGSGHPVLATLQYGRGILEIKGCGWGVSDHINRQQKVLVKVVVFRTVRDSNRVASKCFRKKCWHFPCL